MKYTDICLISVKPCKTKKSEIYLYFTDVKMDKDLERALRCICAGYRTELFLSDVLSWVYICMSDSAHKKGNIFFTSIFFVRS